MRTYTALIETPSGSQHAQLAAMNIQNAEAQIEVRARNSGASEVRYSIQEQAASPVPEASSSLLSASAGLFGCLIILIIATHVIRRYFKD